MADKKSFVVYFGISEILDELTDEETGKLFRAMVDYAATGTEPDFSGAMRLAWIPVRQTLERDSARYSEMVEKRRKAGQKGGKASAEARRSKSVGNTGFLKQNEANEANQADNDNENVNVIDNENVNVCVNDNENVNEGRSAQDDTHTDSDLVKCGTLHNVELTRGQYQEILSTYQNARKLINKVSTWLPDANRPNCDHYALVHKFAVNDDWPKKPEPEKPPDPPDPARGKMCSMPDDVREKMREVIGYG